MMLWVEPMMWALCRMLAFTMQLVGLLGLMGYALIGLMYITDKILEV